AGGDSWLPYTVEGRPAPPPGQEPYAAYRIVSPDYFRSLSVPLRRGRFFTGADARNALPLIRWYEKQPDPPRFSESQPMPVVIVNETLARQLWPGEDPIGRRIKAVYSPWLTVIGVVGDVRHTTLAARPNPEMYLLHLQEPQASMRLTVRTSGDPLRLAAAVRERVRALDQDLPLGLATMEQIVTDSVGRQRFNLLLLGSLGAAALLLAVVGVFGVVNYSVAQRTHEIGIRVALGAQERDVLGLVIRQGMTPALLGVALGVAGSLALTRWMQELLYGVSATDPLTFALVALLLTLVALAACYLPARRAARVDPLVALRQQ
ncbi:MAG TPA: FtsX-like permease family protein, partial [Blastocatellia bacterium]|nr:FtsX-like permease family protein [Blastocatellia bacterium]